MLLINIIKFLAIVIAIISTCLYINNIISDIGSALTWRTSLSLDGEPNIEDIGKQYAALRIILSIVMGISWGLFIIL